MPRTNSSGNKKYKNLTNEAYAHKHEHKYEYGYSQRHNNNNNNNNKRILFDLRLLLRYIHVILDLLKRNKLKAIFISLIAIALALTLTSNSSFNNPSSISNADPRLKNYNNNNNYGMNDYNYDYNYAYDNKNDYDYDYNTNDYSDDDYDYYYHMDVSELDLSDYEINELYQQGLLISSQNTDVHDDMDGYYYNSYNNNDINSDDEDIFFEDNIVKVNRNITIDELKRRKENEINRKVAQRVKKWKDSWLKGHTSKEKIPSIQFEDTLEGSVAQSLARHGFKPKGSLVMYVSDSEINDIVKTIDSVQAHFNNWVQYPWILVSVDGKEFNNTEWVDRLKKYNIFRSNNTNTTSSIVSNESNSGKKTKIFLETVSDQFWAIPKWIDVGKLAQARNILRLEPHIESIEYKIWTRYFTGFLPLESFMSNYDWMWYIKPGTELFCDVDYDVFRYMQDSKKLIGLSGSRKVDNLPDFQYEKYYKFLNEKHKDIIRKTNLELFLLRKDSKENDKKLDKCELLVEGFSISNLNFWRSKVYQKYFEIIDKEGTIFHNAWTINKVQTLAITLLINEESFQFLDNLGFQNDDYSNCPIDDTVYDIYRCECDQGSDMTFVDSTCSRKFYDILGIPFPHNWERHSKNLRELKLKQ
ncbi:putative mannosyltransferase PWA37_000937 [Arxiozyma heterogenica]|uniref:putative mannosyltransferase n=1 Tax=Arxiozyma heterogenica TaxID=278026 RepID=UPI002EF8452F